MNEYELDDIRVIKDEISNINDGEAIIECPGYNLKDFCINYGPTGTINVLKIEKREDSGTYELIEIYNFEVNLNYDIKDKNYNVRDGLLIIKVDYLIEENVELNENL